MPEQLEDNTSGSSPAWRQQWPADELERVPACPLCNCSARELLLGELVDNVFFVAPGSWTLYRCSHCRSAYLDPRPNAASIGKAYGVYYTHAADDSGSTLAKPGLMRHLKSALTNGYVNSRYGTRRQPASTFGVWLAKVLPQRRQKRDAEFRYLPKPHPGQRLLDIGCGNGNFLINARDAGWDATGVDPDPKAVAAAQQRGLVVRVGSIELFEGESATFDAITLSHVLEHLHDPVQFIRAVHRLLKPGGVIFVDTPNIESLGLQRWGRDWRGLEPPRHLLLFSPAGLVRLLNASGFQSIQRLRRTAVRKSIYLASLRMQLGKSPYDRLPKRLPLLMRMRLFWTVSRIEDDEFITLVARKRG